MRAAVLTGPRSIQIQDVPIPVPGQGEVRIRLEGCGLCGSNVPNYIGLPWTRYPGDPGGMGHEGWGHVDAVGPGVRSYRPGDRVAALSYHAYAEYDVAPEHALIRIPEALGGSPFPGEALGCAMNIFKRADIRAGQTVAIVGVGFLGALLCRLAKSRGARVLAISRRAFSLRVAAEMGADVSIPMLDHGQIINHVRELTSGVFCDRVIEAVGTQWPLDLASELTRERGKLIIAGYHQEGPRQINMQLWNWRGLDVINAHERDTAVYVQGIEAAASAVASGHLAPEPLYSRFPLERIGDAFEAAANRPDGFLKALVMS